MAAERVVSYKASVAKDLRKLGRPAALRVISKIEKVLQSSPHPGEALSGEYSGLYKIRVGNYRAIYARTVDGYLVLRIAHRREVYRKGRP